MLRVLQTADLSCHNHGIIFGGGVVWQVCTYSTLKELFQGGVLVLEYIASPLEVAARYSVTLGTVNISICQASKLIFDFSPKLGARLSNQSMQLENEGNISCIFRRSSLILNTPTVEITGVMYKKHIAYLQLYQKMMSTKTIPDSGAAPPGSVAAPFGQKFIRQSK